MTDLITKIFIIYIIGYVISFIIMYYNRVETDANFIGTNKQLIKEFFISFVWPIIFTYIVLVTILKYVSLVSLTAFVYIKEIFLNLFSKQNKNNIEEYNEPQKEIEEEE